MEKRRTARERFWSRVERDMAGGCWLWTGAANGNGYGAFRLDGRNVPVHRMAWELLRGPIAPGQVIDHLCRVKLCVNPLHLEPVPAAVNVRRGIRTKLTPEQVAQILRAKAAGMRLRDLASRYGISRPHASMIGRTRWRDASTEATR